MSDILEILAPAGDLETLKVAVDNGADAVYVGASKFNARAGAKNFDMQQLQSGVEYAHLFGAKVYLTVNTIIKNSEMPDVLQLVDQAVEIGVDAFLVQDMGLAMMLKNKYKNIELHASTQLAVHNLAGAQMLQKLGFTRVVLARESTLQDIKDIKNNTNLQIEYFVHGAICVGFSGNCYLSSLCHSASGNRGRCKQLCRLPYTAFDGNKQVGQGFLLSPSDQCLAARLSQLAAAGVNSFKIEGRLKKPSYVASAVSTFKTALGGGNIKDKLHDLKQIFSRGEFNTGQYLDGKNDGIINTNTNNHLGKQIGVVKSVVKFKDIYKIQLSSSHCLTSGDALKFLFNGKEICSLGVGNVEKLGKDFVVYSKNKPVANAQVFLIVDAKLEQKWLSARRALGCDMSFVARAGQPATLEAICGDHSVIVETAQPLQKAKTSALTFDDAWQSFCKLNDTVFQLKNLQFDCDDVFVAKSVLNDLRRRAVEALKSAILQSKKPNVKPNNKPFEELFCTCQNNYMVVEHPQQISGDKYAYIFAPDNYQYQIIKQAVDIAKQNNAKLYLDLPNIARHADFAVLQTLLSKFESTDFGLIANNLYAFTFAKKFKIVAGLGLNIINKYAKSFYINLGAEDVVYSIESNIDDLDSTCVAYSKGNPVAMTLTHCPFKVLFNTDCSNCSHTKNLTYKAQDGSVFAIRRKKVGVCYFELVTGEFVDNKNLHNCRIFVDTRQAFKRPSKTTTGMLNKKI